MAETYRHSTVRAVLEDEKRSAFARYRALTIPEAGLVRFALFELATMLLLPLPGALGFALRRILLRPFLGAMGRNVIIGRNCVFRHPRSIFLGNSVAIEDGCLFDARGCGEKGLRIGDGTIVSHHCIIKSKAGAVSIGRRVNIGGGTALVSHSGIEVGDGVGLGRGCQINGGTFSLGEFANTARTRTPKSSGPIVIGDGAWLAIGVIVLDGVRIGENAVVSAGSVVTRAVPARAVVQGNPAKKIFEIR